MTNNEKEQQSQSERASVRLERLIGLTLALFAAVLAVVDLGAGKYGDDEIIGTNEKANLYQWYQSKSIKSTIVEHEAQLLTSLIKAEAMTPTAASALREQLAEAEKSVDRYEKEKKEILLGSEAVGAEGQVLKYDGKKGEIVGTQPWEKKLATLGAAGDDFDMATLWLQVALVFGAISLIINSEKLKKGFYCALVLGSLLGTGFGIKAFQIAMSVQPAQVGAQANNSR